MGLIRVSDHAEKLIREHSHGRTITATVDAILAGSVAPDGTEMWKGQPASDDNLRDYLDKKFDELKSLIEDTAVDRVDSGHSNSNSGGRVDVGWPVVQELVYDFLDEDSPEWFPGVYSGTRDMDYDPTSYIKDGILYFETNSISYGLVTSPILRISPRIKAFLSEKGVVL